MKRPTCGEASGGYWMRWGGHAVLGQEGISIVKVNAHTHEMVRCNGKVTHFDIGNSAADRAAKKALAVAKLEAPAAGYNAAIATPVFVE